jgi:hypothetical protein
MFNVPEFHALQCQRCKDLRVEAERERLVAEVERAGNHSNRLADAAHSLINRLSNLMHHS